MTRFLFFVSLALAGMLAGCTMAKSGGASNPEPGVRLNARLIPPADIELTWQDSDSNAVGHVVEYATEPKGDYVILDFIPPEQTTFVHSNLMPATAFYYRVRAYYGPASRPVEVSLPEELSETNYVARFAQPEDYSWAPPKTVTNENQVARASLRTAPAAAAPTGLRVEMMPVTVSGFKLTWADQANDEDGYLLETRPEGDPDFQVCGLLTPNINSLGYGLTPPIRKAAFRVRAFYYGKSSNVASATTRATPEPEANRTAN